MAAELFMWDWQWEYKHRGTLKHERGTHFRELLVKKRGLLKFHGSGTEELAPRAEYNSINSESKYIRRGRNDRTNDEQEVESVAKIFSKAKSDQRKQPAIVYTVTRNRQIRWGRTGRKGYILCTEEMYESEEESETDSEEFEIVERWPEPVKHKGGRPYAKPIGRSDRAIFTDKWVRIKNMKRNYWRKYFLQEPNSEGYFYKKNETRRTDEKISIVDTKKHKSLVKFQRQVQQRKTDSKDIEQIREERRRRRETNHEPECIPPFVGNIPDDVDDFRIISEETANTHLAMKDDKDVGDFPETGKHSQKRGSMPPDPEDGNDALVKLPRDSTRPDLLQKEFRQDYKEARCKPRCFAINVSRIVFHHVTLINRLRLKAIPKLDLTTYLVFTYCKESTPGIDLYRVRVTSTWVGSRRSVFNHIDILKDVIQIQELIQCVVSAIDSVDLNQLVAKSNRMNKKNIQSGNRPTSNFPMLYSVMKWEFTNTSIPQASEWYSPGDAEDKPYALRHILGLHKNALNGKIIKRGPIDPNMCGGCLVKSDTHGGDKLMALDACSHWFCEQCWKSRLLRQIKKEDVTREGIAFCVEEGCDNTVDPITLLTLLSIEKIRNITEGKIRNYLTALAPRVVVCPNESCRQFFSILEGIGSRTTEVAIPIVCRCSCQFCSKCLSSPHWPALCKFSKKYDEMIKQRNDNTLFSKMLLDNELPDDLLSGRKCFNCGRFVRQFVFRKTETNEFGRPVCLQCAKEDNQNNNLHHQVDLNSTKVKIGDKIDTNLQSSSSNVTKWYKVASTHRKMRHPEVVKALYTMAETVADKLVCAVTAGKYVGDAKKASAEWDDLLLEWAESNFLELGKSPAGTSNGDSGVSSTGKSKLSNSIDSVRPTSASSNFSTGSLAHTTEILPSESSVALSKLSIPERNETSDLSTDMTRAACNIVQLKLELHQIAEYVAVLLDYQLELRGKLIRFLERAEDLCSSLGILLHDPHVHNAARILPTFMRLRVQAKHIIENIYNEITNENQVGKVDRLQI